MSWLSVAILAYLIFAVVFLVDKSLLAGPVPSPKLYTFYSGALRLLVIFLIPFVNFFILPKEYLVLSLITGGSFTLAAFWFFKGLRRFEASRIIPAVGGMTPIVIFLLVYCFSFGKEFVKGWDFPALALLIFGSALINYKSSQKISWQSLWFSGTAAFFFALYFTCSKIIYLAYPFWPAFISITIGTSLTSLLFLFSKEVRNGLFARKVNISRKIGTIFVANQSLGAGAAILQNWAVALAPFAYIAMVNAMQGVQYAFVLIFTIFISLKFPKIFQEEIGKAVLVQKTVAILLIGVGLAILAF